MIKNRECRKKDTNIFCGALFSVSGGHYEQEKNDEKGISGVFVYTPWILGFVILQLYPFVSSFIYSFTDYTVGAKATFQGLANYKKLFTQTKEFWNSLKVTILFALYTVPWKTDHGFSSCHVFKQGFKGNQPDPHFVLYSVFVWRKRSSSTVMEINVLDNGAINAILTALHLPVYPVVR